MRSDPNYIEKQYEIDEKIQYNVLDTADYVIPPNELNGVFIMTNFIRTDQFQDSCEKKTGKYKITCRTDDDCKQLNEWNGWLLFFKSIIIILAAFFTFIN